MLPILQRLYAPGHAGRANEQQSDDPGNDLCSSAKVPPPAQKLRTAAVFVDEAPLKPGALLFFDGFMMFYGSGQEMKPAMEYLFEIRFASG